MASALAQVCAGTSPASDAVAELRLRTAQLGDILRLYRVTNHENKRRALIELHTRLSRLVDLLEQLTAQARPADVRQQVVADWAQQCFGDGVPSELRSREHAMRVLEEAHKIAQAEGVTPDEAERLQAHVYGRPPGAPEEEIGGLRVALLAYAAEKGLSAERAEEVEIGRVLAKSPEALRQRQREKNTAGVVFFTD